MSRVLKAAVLALLRAYRFVLSPLFAGSCRFSPSCSNYATEAVRRYGAGRGLWLTARRLARCHPFCQGGVDPVPGDPETPDGVFHAADA